MQSITKATTTKLCPLFYQCIKITKLLYIDILPMLNELTKKYVHLLTAVLVLNF